MRLRQALPATALAPVLGAAAVEWRYRHHPGNDLSFHDEEWRARRSAPTTWTVGGTVRVRNEIRDREVMLRDVSATVHLLSDGDVEGITTRTSIRSRRDDYPARDDGYWVAYVVKPGRYGKDSPMEVAVELHGPKDRLDGLYAVWIELRLDTYGFEGCRDQFHHIVMPLRWPDPTEPRAWQEAADGRAQVRAVRTHLLGPFDDPVEVVRRYAVPNAAPGDIVTLGETPLAVIQRRFRDPRMLRRTYAATRLAQFMHGEGALGTAPGMQSLMDEHGALRVFGALAGGIVGKAAGRAGWFYRLAGPQARLVDDVTGTLPPYDNFVVVGPADADAVCEAITAATGLRAAVVDANDLGKVDVVGASAGVPHELVCAALKANPAGNGDESTPVVLIRPTGGAASAASTSTERTM